MALDSPGIDGTKGPARSRVANDPAALPGVDGRSGWSRRFRDCVTRITKDAGGDDLSEQRRLIIRRAATLAIELEQLEVRIANAGQATGEELSLYSTISGTLRRHLESIGLHKRQPNPFPDLDLSW